MQPVALKPVAAELMRAPAARCNAGAADLSPGEVVAYAQCWRAAYHAAAARLIGLQKAVAVREAAAAKAVQVAAKQ